jgi:6-phosphogluconolactonase
MVRELRTTTDLTASAERLFLDEMHRSVRERGRFAVALSGGSTPLALFHALARQPHLPWDRTLFFWGDERFVAHDSPESNYHNARQAFLDALPVPAANIFPWPEPAEAGAAEGALQDAAASYAATLREVLGEPVIFDLQLLGLGTDCHTASLFPDRPTLQASGLTTSDLIPGVPQPRLSLTPSALSSSRTVAFLLSGAEKRRAMTETLSGEGADSRYPARSVTALEQLIWLLADRS